MKKLSVILISTLFFSNILTSNASAHSGALPIDDILFPPMYREESGFTKIPAGIGGLVTTLPALTIGGTAYVIGSIVGAPFNKEKEVGAIAAVYSGIGIIWLGSTVTGSPFYATEKVLYDLPVAIYKNFSPQKKKNVQPTVTPESKPPSVIPDRKSRSATPKVVPKIPQPVVKKRFIGIKNVETPARICTPRTTPPTGVGKSTGSKILTGSSISMAGYGPRCEEENKK